MAIHKITPFLWYAKEAEEAARFYATIFPDSRVTRVSTMPSESPSVCLTRNGRPSRARRGSAGSAIAIRANRRMRPPPTAAAASAWRMARGALRRGSVIN